MQVKRIKASATNKVVTIVVSSVMVLGSVAVPGIASAKAAADKSTDTAEKSQPVAPEQAVDTKMLKENIDLSMKDLNETLVSVDGTDIVKDKVWVTQESHDKFVSAIGTATAAVIAKTQLEVDTANAALTVAKKTFDDSKLPGKKEPQPAPTPTPQPAPAPETQPAVTPDVTEHGTNTYNGIHHDLGTEGFIASIAEVAREQGQEKNIFASVMIAQAILESGSGTSELSKAPNNNLFGIKGVWKDKDGNAHSVNFDTKEDDGTGSTFTIKSDFRTYTTTADSIEDYANLITDTDKGMGNYYKAVWKTNAKDYKEACAALQGSYATDTGYAKKLVDLIEAYHLDQYDNPNPYDLVGKKLDPKSELADKATGYRDLTNKDYAALLSCATQFLGKQYTWGGSTPATGFDCSGLTHWIYQETLGIDIGRTTYVQQYQGKEVSFDELRMGDLLFFEKDKDVYHVAMYIGNGFYIESPQPGDSIKITAMEENTPTFAKRICTFQDKVIGSDAQANEAAKMNVHKMFEASLKVDDSID